MIVLQKQKKQSKSSKNPNPDPVIPKVKFKKPITMADLLASEGYKSSALRRNQEVEGKVVAILPNEILVDIGAKSEGVIASRDIDVARDIAENLAVGDSIQATVVYPENDAGQVVLSLRKFTGERRWQELDLVKSQKSAIEVLAVEVNRGGIICEWQGLRGFLPASQLLQPTSKMDQLIGKSLEVRVIELDKTTNRLIFSQKAPDDKRLKQQQDLLSKIDIGEKYKGIISAVLPFGLFVEIDVGRVGNMANKSSGQKKDSENRISRKPESLNKLEGLVHISEISWEKIDEVGKLYKVGDKVEVLVTAKDLQSGRLNLSLKQLALDPFLEASAKYSKDQKITGTVSKSTPYGVFVTLENGVEGLIHISKIPPDEAMDVGKKLECTIESVDTAARRISLVPVIKAKPILYR